jgi:hypothetical protein
MFAFVVAAVAITIVAVGFLSWICVTLSLYWRMRRYRALVQFQALQPAAPVPAGWVISYKEGGKLKTYKAQGSTEGEAIKDFMVNGKAQFTAIVSVEHK